MINLKNRPKQRVETCGTEIIRRYFPSTTALEEWFEGFESQERKEELYLRSMPEANLQHLRDKVRAYEKHLKEILGDA